MKQWILFTTYGWFLGILLVIGFAILIEEIIKIKDELGGQAAVGIGMGAGVGLMQWLSIRKYITSSQKFFWFTFSGFSIAFILRDIISSVIDMTFADAPITVEVTIPFAVLLGAFISGWLQYKFIFKGLINKATNWILYSMAGWLLATFASMSAPFFNIKTGEDFPKALIVIYALLFLSIGGPILGYITGKFIVPKVSAIQSSKQRSGSIPN